MRASRRLALPLLLTAALAACGGSQTAPVTPTPSAPSFFPASDTPYGNASAFLKSVWMPYQVQTIPGVAVLANQPKNPPVYNLTGGALNNLQAEDWAAAFMRTAVLQRWAAAHAQTDFLAHLNPALDTTAFGQGATETLPDCYIFPTSLAIVEEPASYSSDGSTFALVAAFTGPCKTTINLPDGEHQDGDSFAGGSSFHLDGYLTHDPIMGELWITLNSNLCSPDTCAQLPPSPPPDVHRPQMPVTATPMTQATPELQKLWQPYGLQLVPPQSVIATLPHVPVVHNLTKSVVNDEVAQEWGVDLFRDSSWLRWSWLTLQLDFQKSLADSSLLNDNLLTDARQGGRPAIPDCGIYPQSLELHQIDGDTRGHATGIDSDAYYFLATYPAGCSVKVSFPDGHSTTEDLSRHPVLLFGSVRADPLLGDIWFTDNAVEVTG